MYRWSFILHHRMTGAKIDLKVVAPDIDTARRETWKYDAEYIIGDCRHCAII